jgi:MFS family permease
VRFLPSTLMVMVIGPVAGRLTDKVGPRPLLLIGLVTVAASLLWQSFLRVDSGFGFLLPAFVAMGAGIALVMSPMSTAAMNSVHQAKAGVASGVLSMSRMVGGTFGVAALGALVAALGRSKLGELLPALPAGQREQLVQSLGSGAAPAGGAASPVAHAMRESFVYALQNGLRLGAAVALVGAVAAAVLITRHPARPGDHEPIAVGLAVGTPAAEEAAGELRREPARA